MSNFWGTTEEPTKPEADFWGLSKPMTKVEQYQQEQKAYDAEAEKKKVGIVNTLKEIPTGIKETGKGILGALQSAGQSTWRGFAALGQSADTLGRNILGLYDPSRKQELQDSKPDFTPQGQFQKDLYGTDKAPTLTSVGEEIPGLKGSKIAPFAGFAVAASDLIPGGNEAKTGVVAALKNIDTAEGAVKVLSKLLGMSKEVATKYAPEAAKLTDELKLGKLVDNALRESQDIKRIAGKAKDIIKSVPDGTKRKMMDIIDYIRGDQPVSKEIENEIVNLQKQYNIPADISSNKLADHFQNLIEKTKTTGGEKEVLVSKTSELPKPSVTQVSKVPEPALKPSLQAESNLSKLPRDISSDINKVNTNLNLDHINVSPESKKIIQQTVDEVKPLIEKSVGQKLSSKEAINLAERSSKTLNRVVGRDETLNWQASMLKARQALAHASENGTVDENYIKNLLTIKTQGTDIARKLQSLSVGADAIEPTAKQAIMEAVLKTNASVDEILKASKGVDFKDLNQATEFYRKFVKPTTGEWLDLVRYNSMLSSPKTHIVNVFSNLVNTTLVAPIEKTLTGGLDFLASGITGNPRKYYAGEGAAHLTNYFKNIKDATYRFADVMGGNRAFTNLDTRFIPIATKGVKGKVVSALSYPTKLLEGMDQFFTSLSEGAAKGSLEYRASKGVKMGNIASEASKEAQYRLFRQKPLADQEGHLLNAVDQFTVMMQGLRNNKNPIVSNVSKFTVPFIQTPMNIFKQGIEYSPMGFGTLAGAANKTEQLSKAIIGSSIFAGAATLLSSNRLTFGEPIDETGKRNFRESGMLPYSVKIGDKWVSYQKLPPALSFPLALTAGIHDAIKSKKMDDGTAELILSAVSKYGTFLSEQSYAKSIGDMLSSVKGGEAGIANVISNYSQQLMPYRAFTGWLARLTDKSQRKIDSKADFIDKQVQLFMMNIPGLTEKVPARLDSQGQPIPNQSPVLNAFSPVQTSKQTDTQTKDYENTQAIKQLNKEKTFQNAEVKDKLQPVYDQAKALLDQDKGEEADKLVADLSDADFEAYKKIRTAERAKSSAKFHDLLAVDPKSAVEFVRSQNKREQQRLLDLLSNEEYNLYEQGK